jgi:RNA polymerase sigma-70 factor (ECF subfamily)
MDDHQLIRQFKESGDKRAFEKILTRYESRVFHFGFRRCGHVQDAEDVVQETFVSAYRYLKDFREESSLLSWLLRIASSVCIKKRRLRKDEPRSHESFESLHERGAEDSVVETTDESPSALMLRQEMTRVVREIMAELPPAVSTMIELRDIEGLSTREVAETLGISETAAKVRLHRARAALYKRFTEVYHDETTR